MRVLLLTDWNPLQGGAEVYAVKLREALIAAGDDVRLLTANVSARAREVADYLAPASDRAIAKSVLQVANPFAAAAVRSALRTFHPDVAVVNMFALYLSPAAIAALGDVPYVLLVTDYKCICPLGHRLLPDGSVCHHAVGRACRNNGCLSWPHWLRDQLRYRRIGEVIRGAASVLVPSEALRSALAEQGIRSECIHQFSDPPYSLFLRQPAASPLFLYVGRLDREKGVDVLLRAFAIAHARMPQCQLRIIGQGSSQAALQGMAGDLGLDACVTFCGWQEPREIDFELGRAWALVAPSRWAEPFGLVALEAIFRGVPAVVPELGGFAETVRHGVSGLLYPPGDVSALAERMLSIADGSHFPRHTLDPAQVAQAQQQFSRARHLALLRALLQGIAGHPAASRETRRGGTASTVATDAGSLRHRPQGRSD